jgi:hypothetical protein
MKAHSANLINSIALVVIGLWDYVAAQALSSSNMIPVAAGIILLFLYIGVKKEDKIIAHIAVVITLLVILSLIKPFVEAIESSDISLLIRNLILILTGILAMVYFVKSFIDARRNR